MGAVAGQRAAVPERHPEVSALVDGEAVRRRPLHADERARRAEVAARRVEVEGADLAGATVGEVHGRPVGAPADPVRDRQPLEDERATPVQLEAIEASGPRRLLVGHAPGPEAALGIAAAVVRADAAAPRLRLRQLAHASALVEPQEAASGCEHVAAPHGRRRSAHVTANLERADAAEAAVVAERGPVHPAGQDVDPEELAAGGVPARTLGEQSRRRGAPRHDPVRGGRHPRSEASMPMRRTLQ
jgi:hypothetical protein